MRNIEEKFLPTVSKLRRKFKRQLELTKKELKDIGTKPEFDLDEEAPTNSAGAGNIDGIGVGDKGEPGISKRVRPRILRRKEAEAAQHNQEVKAWRRKATVNVTEMKRPLWKVPQEPGSTPTPEGKIKLYHQTSDKNLSSIRKQGIKLSHAKGYEGPKAIYASPPDKDNKGFYGPAHSTPTAEFHVNKDEYSKPFVRKDEVPSKDIIAHKEWHATVRYIDSDPELRKAVENGEHDDLMKQGNHDKFAKAVRFIKKRAKSSVKEETFAGAEVFPVSTEVFMKARFGKPKYGRYTSIVGDDDIGKSIRQFGRHFKTKHKPIIVKDEKTGAMTYFKQGKVQ